MANRTCSIDGCERPHKGHGYCDMHYQRWRKGWNMDGRHPRPEGPLTVERLRKLLDYDPLTGEFRWKVYRAGLAKIGDVAGGEHTTKRYRVIGVDGQRYLAHRLAWLYMHGVWPNGDLDHHNQTPSDNRIANLREATRSQNLQNQSRPHHGNASGFIGVFRANRGWRAAIGVNGEHRYLGYFTTPEEASAAYLAAKAELHPFGQ